MKIQSFLYGLAAAFLLSLICVIPFLPFSRQGQTGLTLEATLRSEAPAVLQVYFDIGRGINEADSVRQAIPGGNRETHLRLPLPEGNYRAFRLDPLDRAGRLELRDLCLRNLRGRTLHAFKPSDIQAVHELEAIPLQNGAIELRAPEKATDPMATLSIQGSMALKNTPLELFLFVLGRALPLFSLFAGALWLCLFPKTGNWLRSKRDKLTARPRLCLALVSALAVCLACYAVLFCGKSYVSPNHGSLLLYDHFPTLPESQDASNYNVHGTDVGAIMWQNIPYTAVEHQAFFKHGEIALWNRMNSGGVTLLGQGQSMLGDPLHLLLPVLFDNAAWAWDLKFVIARWCFAFGIGLVSWSLTRHLPSALLAAISSAFVGFFLQRLNHPAYSNFCYAPWILVGWLGVLQAGDRRRALLAASLCLLGSWGTFTGGSVKEACMLLLCMHLSGALMLAFSDLRAPEKYVRLALMSLIGLIFLLLSAPLWISLRESLARAYTSLGENGAYQIQGGLLLGLFDELFYRPMVEAHMVFNPSANLLVLAGVLYFLVTLRRGGHSRLSLGLAVSALPPLLFAFGVIPGRWIHAIPFIGVIGHIDNTFSCVLVVILCALSGAGFHAAWKRLGSPEGRSDIGLVCLGLALITGAYLSFIQTAHRQIYSSYSMVTLWRWSNYQHLDAFVWGSLWAMLAAIVALLFITRHSLRRREWSPAAIVAALLCCSVLLWRHALHSGAGFEDYLQQPGLRANLTAPSPALAAVRKDATEPFRIAGVEETLFPGWSALYGLEGISGPDALMSPRYRELIDALAIERLWDWRLMLHSANFKDTRQAINFLNVRYLVADAKERGTLSAQLQHLKTADLDVYRNNQAWPRAFFTDRLLSYGSLPELATLIRQAKGPFAASQIGDKTVPGNSADEGSGLSLPASGYALTANTTRFTVDAPRPGYAVLQETWADLEFRAYVDGRKAKYFRVNHAFKAVLIETPGRHEVRFEYVPRHWLQAKLMALAGLGLFAGLWIVELRRGAA